MRQQFNSTNGPVDWAWSDSNDAHKKATSYQWWIPKKSDFYIIGDLPRDMKQDIKNELWLDLQFESEWTATRYKIHKSNKKAAKQGDQNA